MSTASPATLAARLAAARAAPPREPEGALELACIAGLLQRAAPAHPGLCSAERWLDRDGAALIHQGLDAVAQRELQEAVLSEGAAALDRLDALCAAATWADATAALRPTTLVLTRIARAFPEDWVHLAAEATRRLAATPPRRRDPAKPLWAAIEASPWALGAL